MRDQDRGAERGFWEAVAVLNKHRIPIGAVIVNRVFPPDATGDFLARRREREAVHLASIADKFRAYPLYHVPLFETRLRGGGLATNHGGDVGGDVSSLTRSVFGVGRADYAWLVLNREGPD